MGKREGPTVINCRVHSLTSCGFLSIPLKITAQCHTTWHRGNVVWCGWEVGSTILADVLL